MPTPSSRYAENYSVDFKGKTYKYSDTIRNIYPTTDVNTNIDMSAAFIGLSNINELKKIVPTYYEITNSDATTKWVKDGEEEIQGMTVYKGKINSRFSDSTSIGNPSIILVTPFASNRNAGYLYNGYNDSKSSNNLTTINNYRVPINFKNNEQLCRPTITGIKYSELVEALSTNTTKLNYEIQFADFIANPSDYLVADFNPTGRDNLVWNYDTNKYEINNAYHVMPMLAFDNKVNSNGLVTFGSGFWLTKGMTNADGIHTYRLTTFTASGGSTTHFQRSLQVDCQMLPSQINMRLEPSLKDLIGSSEWEPNTNRWENKIYEDGNYVWFFKHSYGIHSTTGVFNNYTVYPHAFLKGEFVYKMLTCTGLYYVDTGDTAIINTLDINHLYDSEHVYLCEIDESGNATGRLIQGVEIQKSTAWNVDGEGFNPNFTPGSGGGSFNDDPSDPITFSTNTPSGGGLFSQIFGLTLLDASDLSTFINNVNEVGFDPLASCISFSVFPIDVSSFSGGDQQIVWKTYQDAAIKKVIESGVVAKRLVNTVKTYNLGSITIERRMTDRGIPFLDYSCGLEIYIPFCGVLPLDTQFCMGRTITAYLTVDISTGGCVSVVYADSTPVAYGSGKMSATIPLTSGEYGIIQASLIEGGVKAAFSGVGAIAGFATKQSLSAGQSLYEMGTRIGRTIYGLNSNSTSISGSFSGAESFRLPMTAYINIKRPHFKIASNYGHTFARPTVETKAISSCSGLTVCVNPDISGITCTDDERKLIQEKLSTGIFV